MSSILPLPAGVVAQIKSSITITSLNGVILELLKNSLDASSSKVNIDVDYSRGCCTMEDDGCGILPAEFEEAGGLGKLYHSSKYNALSPTHGRRGSFLASLCTLSLTSITSRHADYRSQNSITINRSEVIARQIPVPLGQNFVGGSHGTQVVVRDLFGNMPVRVKQRALASVEYKSEKDWDAIRRGLISLLLAWPYPLLLNIRNGISGRRLQLRGASSNQLSMHVIRNDAELLAHVCNILSQASMIQSPDKSSWVYSTASTPLISIQGVISLKPVPTKSIQFISSGITPLDSHHGYKSLYDDINNVFASSDFGVQAEVLNLSSQERQRRLQDRRFKGDTFTNQDLKVLKKGVDRWPMFYIKIDTNDVTLPRLGEATDGFPNEEEAIWSSVSELVQLMLVEFLRSHHFLPKFIRHHISDNAAQSETIRSVFMGSTAEGNHGLSSSTSHITPQITGKCHSRETRSGEQYISTRSGQPKIVRSKRVGSPFDSWSRIKSGRPSSPFGILPVSIEDKHGLRGSNNVVSSSGQLTQHSEIARQFQESKWSVSQLRGSQGVTEVPQNDRDATVSLISRAGEINLRPFENLPPISPSEESPIAKLAIAEATTTNQGDRSMLWVNSVTKEGYYIDTRTGLVKTTPSHTMSTLNERKRPTYAINTFQEPSAWVKEILRGWNNPIYKPAEASIPQIVLNGSCISGPSHLNEHERNYLRPCTDLVLTSMSAGIAGRIDKRSLKHAELIAQVDKKFILVKIRSAASVCIGSVSQEMLVVVDQHAADERCRIEDLIVDLFGPLEDNATPGFENSLSQNVLYTPLIRPIAYDISYREVQLLRKYTQYFTSWGIIYKLPPPVDNDDLQTELKIIVTALPPGIAERCKAKPGILIDLIRAEAWNQEETATGNSRVPFQHECLESTTDEPTRYSWLRRIHDCPQGILDMLTSRACRSSIMFNDELSNSQCKTLISRLAETAFPFQCAHGRPSMVPVVDLNTTQQNELIRPNNDEQSFGHVFNKWKRTLANNKAGDSIL